MIVNDEGGEIDFENVEFTYPTKKDVKVCDGININVGTNKIVALVGASGCGKSSLIQLVERFYDPDAGRVLFNKHDLRELHNKWYHQNMIALVQ